MNTIVAPKSQNLKGRALGCWAKTTIYSMPTDWLYLFGGVEVAACVESFKVHWGSPPHPVRKTQKQGRLYNREGNQLNDGRMAERLVVSKKLAQQKTSGEKEPN